MAPIPFSYPFARAPFFIPLTFLNALLIPHGRVSPCAATPRASDLANQATISFSANSAAGRRAATTDDGGAGERKASRSRHIRIVFQTRPSLRGLRLPLSPRFETARPLPPRRCCSARTLVVLRAKNPPAAVFPAHPVSYRGVFLSSTSSSTSAFFSPSPSRCLSLSPSSLSFSLPRLPFRLCVSFLFCVL